MTINYQFEDVDAHGATVRAPTLALGAGHQTIALNVPAAGAFWGGAASSASQGFIAELSPNFQIIDEQANAHGANVQTAGSNMFDTDSELGSGWA
jgi:Proteins of 100 residues with WXG